MEDKGVTISIINNNPGVVIKADTPEKFEELAGWAFPAFKALRKKWADYLEENKITPQNDVMAAYDQPKTSYPPCKSCGGEQVYNPKTGKVFCVRKCWLNNGQLKNQ